MLGMFFQGSGQEEPDKKPEQVRIIKKIELTDQSGGEQEHKKDGGQETSTFFIEPSAGELVERLAGLDPVELDEKAGELPGLKVMWPLYFFSLTKLNNGSHQLLLDVAEDGFGISVLCDVDIKKYPQISKVKEGELLWVAGEIIGLIPDGTGQFLLKTEQIRFGGTKEQPPTAPVYQDGE